MAEQDELDELEAENVNVEIETVKLNDSVAISRYIWTRALEPNFTNEKRGNLTCFWNTAIDFKIRDHIKSLAETNPAAVVNLIKKAIQSNALRSMDESLWCLAYCMQELRIEVLSNEIKKDFVQLIPSSDDLLYFMNYFRQDKLSFPRSMRTCLEKWYDSKSASELLEILFAASNIRKVSHADILRLLHLRLESDDKKEIIKATYMKYADIKAAAETSMTMKRILKYKDLKRAQEFHEILSILKRKDFVYKPNHLPTKWTKSAEVVELILPNMTLFELLDHLPMLCANKMLRPQESVSRKICNALQCSNKTIADAKLNPVYVLNIIRTLEKKMKNESTATSAAAANEKIKDKDKKISNPFVIKKLQNIFQQSFNNQPKTGCRFYITVDFRKFSDRQSEVFGMKDVSCSEIQALCTLSLLKNEKDVTVMSFTEDRNKLKPVAWTSETTYDKAMEIYENEIKEKPKTKENFILPLRKAMIDKKKVDVFIIFVSSVGRTVGKDASPPLEWLQNYRKTLNLNMTKLIVINLTRKSPDFKLPNKDINETGILEIVGFSPDTMKIIQAYANNCFV